MVNYCVCLCVSGWVLHREAQAGRECDGRHIQGGPGLPAGIPAVGPQSDEVRDTVTCKLLNAAHIEHLTWCCP